ncbi:type II toxin-antitoxin system VapB family antitoxin [Rhodoferax sp.]|uniref:type II toxin-antitoxin system VapB family antitoxin n=1 Tax=Rhodoferax sp. TaxID=50421 RepID=UPI002605D33D|nr:type II toxin-antitoxin system VapB family antitoxin [Rhodoferax sp.]MDD5481097.1 type II toxin-antitoxin system VapB family antitoxin [Rhodoferax sp.]
MNTRTNIVIDDDLIAQAMLRAGVSTKKAAVEAALRAFVRKPDYSGLLALRGADVLDPDYDPRGPYGLTPEALARRGWHTFEEARIAVEKQSDALLTQSVAAVAKPVKASRQKPANKSQVADA